MSFADVLDRFSAATARVEDVVQIDGQPVSGILDRGYVDVAGMGTTRPTFTCAHSAVPYVAEGSTLVAPADLQGEIAVYEVRQPEPDGTGLVVLPLTLT